jgi:hypothetical protein
LARENARVRVASRQAARAREVCAAVDGVVPGARLEALETRDENSLRAAIGGVAAIIAAGAPGVELLPDAIRREANGLKLAIDLNAVPPAGIGGIQPQDKAADRDGQICYGAIGVGGTKMKLHKAAIRRLFESNDAVLDAEEIYALGAAI